MNKTIVAFSWLLGSIIGAGISMALGLNPIPGLIACAVVGVAIGVLIVTARGLRQ
jgi:hypothetical protein